MGNNILYWNVNNLSLALLESNRCNKLMIKRTKEGYKVVSEKGRNMGLYKTLKDANTRLRQIEYFKHKK